MNSKKRCARCGDYFPAADLIKINSSWYCSYESAVQHGRAKAAKLKARKKADEDKAFRRETKRRKDAIKGRTGKKGFYEDLKTAIHAYVKHVLRKGEPCYTCGKQQRFEDDPRAFHCGHYMPAGTIDPRRFMLANLRMQCFSCNSPKSGNQAVYRKRLTEEMGQDHVDWLECIVNHKSLEEQYPTIDSIKAEISKYRKLLKEGRQ